FADEALPRAVRQECQLADALVLLEVGENLLDDLQLLLERDIRGERGSMAEAALLRVGQEPVDGRGGGIIERRLPQLLPVAPARLGKPAVLLGDLLELIRGEERL